MDKYIYINNDTIRMYNPDNRRKYKGPCKPMYLNEETLSREDGVFMTKEVIKEKCDCTKKDLCLMLMDLTKEHNPKLSSDKKGLIKHFIAQNFLDSNDEENVGKTME